MTKFSDISWELSEASRWLQRAKEAMDVKPFDIHARVDVQTYLGFVESDLESADELIQEKSS